LLQNLKSPQELEEEDRQAKSAKLQELIRRGTPKDLLKAQELMKDLSGFEPDQQPNYEEQTAKELDKVQSKAILLNDMLNSTDEGKTIGRDGDEYDQVARAVRAARPKIQKWIAEVSEDAPDSLDRLLLMNDLINGVLERFEECKRGDWAKGRGVDVSQYTAPPAAEPSLISFDAFADSPPAGAGIALPSTTDRAGGESSSSTGGAGGMLGGLPADLFSAPSPAATSSASGQLDFFASAPATTASGSGQPLQAKKAIDLSALYQQGFGGASSAAAPGGFNSNGGGGWGVPAQQQRPPFGSMGGQPPPQQPFSQLAAGSSSSSGPATNGGGQSQKKADPFEGLLF
jgi:ADP-ribosylation factor-binding protein GGA